MGILSLDIYFKIELLYSDNERHASMLFPNWVFLRCYGHILLPPTYYTPLSLYQCSINGICHRYLWFALAISKIYLQNIPNYQSLPSNVKD